MNAAFAALTSDPAAVAALILALKVALLLGAASVVGALMRRAPAAARHLVWLGGLAGSLVLAILAGPVRGIEVRVPFWTSSDLAATQSVASSAEQAKLARLRATDPKAMEARAPSSPAGPDAPPLLLPWLSLIGLLWLAGASLVAAWYLLGYVGLARLVGRAQPMTDRLWRSIVDRAAREIGIGSAVEIRRSSAVGTPLVSGWLRPAMVLPEDAATWNPERRRVVALHELAHVARGDMLAQALVGVACVVYWFHPAVWFAARRMRAESERACDDCVLAAGVPGADYASHLLSVARGARSLKLAGRVSIAMARRSTLEGRLLSLLDDRQRIAALTRRARVVALLGVGLCVAALAWIRPIAGVVEARPAAVFAAAKDNTDDREPADGSTVVHRKPVKPGGSLLLDLDTGGSVKVSGWDKNEIEVRGTLAGEDWRDERVEFDVKNNRATLRSVYDQPESGQFSSSNRFEIRVPRRFDIELRSAGGDLTLRDLDGTMHGETGGGEVVMERLKGHARLSTGGGEVRIDDCDMTGTVSTGGGLVTLSRVRGGLKASSGSGPVIHTTGAEPGETGDLAELEVGESGESIGYADGKSSGTGKGGVLHIDRAGGDIHLASAPNGVHATTGGGEVTIGRADRTVYAQTGGGDITVGPASGSVTATTGAGDVHVILARGSGGARTVKIDAGVGNVLLELPRGVGATFDLETGYTKAYGPKASIRSDVPVDIMVSDDDHWDASEGTPRKYVRASATTGDGKLQLQVRTLNGNIVIRYAK